MNIRAIGPYIFFSESSIKYLESIGDFEHVSAVPNEENLVKHGKNADVLFTWGKITPKILDNIKCLKFIGLLSTGYGNETLDPLVSKEYIAKRELTITYMPNCSTSAVVEYTIAAILSGLRNILLPKITLVDPNIPMSYFKTKELFEVKLGIVGLGTIGTEVANVCAALGARAMRCYTKNPYRARKNLNAPIAFCALDDLVSGSDVLVITCELNHDTKGLIHKNHFKQMPKNILIVNSARGNIFNLDDLYHFLENNKDATLVIDELSNDCISQKIKQLHNVIYTPHIAFNTTKSLYNYTETAVNNLKAYLEGHPANVVYMEQVWYE